MDLKQYYTFEDGKLFLKKTAFFSKRELMTCEAEKVDEQVKFLNGNFENLRNDWEKIKTDFSASEEISYFAGKLSRQRSVWAEVKAIGNFEELYNELIGFEKQIEQRVEHIIQTKKQINDEVAAIVHPENWKEAQEQIMTLKNKFRELPQVPHPDDEGLKNKLEELIQHFFNEKQTYFDAFDRELLANLDRKMELCERAEGIQHSDDWRKTSETYNQLMELWKAVGPIPRHKNEELWLRFNTAKDIFYKRKQEFYDHLIENYEANLKLKEALISEAQAISNGEDWNEITDKLNSFMDEWKKIGSVGKEKNDEIWDQFKKIRDDFFERKNNFFSRKKIELENNLAKKSAIAKRAEEIKDSSDFENTTQEFSELMDEWKAIGPSPRKEANQQWDIFIQAKKHFFERKDEERDVKRGELIEIIENRMRKNRGFLSKIQKELELELDVMRDFSDRLANLAPSARSFESKERYENIVAEAKRKVNTVEQKVQDVQKKIDTDFRELKRLKFQQKRKEENEPNPNAQQDMDENVEIENIIKKEVQRIQPEKKHNKKNASHTKPKTLLGEALKGLKFDNLD